MPTLGEARAAVVSAIRILESAGEIADAQILRALLVDKGANKDDLPAELAPELYPDMERDRELLMAEAKRIWTEELIYDPPIPVRERFRELQDHIQDFIHNEGMSETLMWLLSADSDMPVDAAYHWLEQGLRYQLDLDPWPRE